MHLLTKFHADQRSLRGLKVKKNDIFLHFEFFKFSEKIRETTLFMSLFVSYRLISPRTTVEYQDVQPDFCGGAEKKYTYRKKNRYPNEVLIFSNKNNATRIKNMSTLVKIDMLLRMALELF